MHDFLMILMIAWGAVTAILICLLIYRGTLEAHEDDQVFLDAAGDSMAAEQRMIVAKIDKLSRPITLLMIASGALLVIAGAIWGWDAYQRFGPRLLLWFCRCRSRRSWILRRRLRLLRLFRYLV